MSKQEKSTIDILNEIRTYRNSEIESKKRNDISVITVEYFGEGEKTKKDIFRLIEKQEFKDKPSVNIEKFYLYEENKPKLIAVKNLENQEVIPVGIYTDQQDLWSTYKEDIEKCIEERETQLKAIAEKLGIDKQEIVNLSEIDLEQLINEQQDKEEILQDEEKKDNNSNETLTEKQVKSISFENEIDLGVQIDTKGTTLRKETGLEQYTKIEIVHAHKLSQLTDDKGNKGKRENLKFGLVGKKNDGTYEKISTDKIKMYRGNNNEVTGIKNPQEVERQNDDCIFEITGTNKRLVIRQEDVYGRPEVYLASSSRDNDGNMAQKLQDRYDGTEKTDVKVRELFNKNKGTENIKNMANEAKQHPVDEEIDLDEVDGDLSTGHQHQITVESILLYNGEKMTVKEIANLPRYKISPEEFVEKYNKKADDLKENDELENIYDEIEEDVNNEYKDPQFNR